MSDYIVSKTLGYGNTINVSYCTKECAAKFNYNVPSYVCGNRIESNRFLDNFTIIQDNNFTIIYEALYQMGMVFHNKISGEYELSLLGMNYKASDFNELIIIMEQNNIDWDDKHD